MRKLIRYSAAACLLASLLAFQTTAAYAAEEAYGPGFIGGVPIDQAEANSPADGTGTSSGDDNTAAPDKNGQAGAQTPGQGGQNGAQAPGQEGQNGAQTPGQGGQNSAQTPGQGSQNGAQAPGQSGQNGAQAPGQGGQNSSQAPGQEGQNGAQLPGQDGQGGQNGTQTPDGTVPSDENGAEEQPQQPSIPFPRLQTTVMTIDNQWSRPFVNDEWISVGDQGFKSISVFITETVGNVLYRAYTAEHGWTPWVMNGQQTAMYGDSAPIRAVQMRLSGYVNNQFDIYYTSILSDGTVTDWAHDGGGTGAMGNDKFMTGFRMALTIDDQVWPYATEKPMDSPYQDGVQLIDGNLRYINGDGTLFTGWGWINNDRYYFQDSVPGTGWHYIDGYKYYFDISGKLVQDLEPIIGAGGPHLIKINKEMNCLTIYVKDGDNGFIIPLKSFLCSTGDDTPIGTYKTPVKYRWRDMDHGIYTQYATRIVNGFLIHSILYSSPDPYTLSPETYNYLGVARSAGCIRLVSSEAKWIYDNCPLGTTVTIYNDPVPGPYERPAIEQIIPDTQNWDPTDINVTQ